MPELPDRLRAFVAIRLGAAVEAALAAFIGELRTLGADVRWTGERNLHVTLKFLGAAAPRERVAAMRAALAVVARETRAFDVTVRGAGAFPGLARPRIVWAGLESAGLDALAARVDDAAAGAGFARETRAWAAHLTLGRVRASRGLGRLRRALEEARGREFGAATIDSLTLYRSTLAPGGSIYEPLASFAFGAHD
jgi:RNA 2',3'-cyclic 3'-phosphodiesterase